MAIEFGSGRLCATLRDESVKCKVGLGAVQPFESPLSQLAIRE
jgi:hypothetical protein